MIPTTRLVPLLCLLLTAAGVCPGLSAQTTSVGVTIPITSLLFLSSSGSVSFPAATDAVYTAGALASSAGPTLTHRANTPYAISISTQAGSTLAFTPLAGRSDADPLKATTQPQLRATTGAAVGAMTGVGPVGSPNTFYTRAARGGTLTTTVSAQLLLSYANDPPGTYSTTVVFTIVAQ